MNKFHILSAGIGLLALVQTASADVTVRLTGSTAFRSAVSHAIVDLFGNSGNTFQGVAYTGTSSDYSGASQQIFKGTISGIPGTVTVKTNWSGSVEGIRDVAHTPAPNNLAYIADGQAVAALPGTNGVSTSVSEAPGIAMADCFQSSTQFKSGTFSGQTYTALAGSSVGIVPFAWVKNYNAPAAIADITTQAAKRLLSQPVPAGVFANNSDQTPIYPVGRYFGSGTRLTQLAEIGFGTLSTVIQYAPVDVNDVALATPPANGVISYIDIDGNSNTFNTGGGQTSGKTVHDFLREDTSHVTDFNSQYGNTTPSPIGFIGALGEADSYAAVWDIAADVEGAGNGAYLTYNGEKGFDGHAYKYSIGTTLGSPIITVPFTAGVVAGQIVTLPGFVASGAVVSSVTDGTHLVLDQASVATTAGTTGVVGALLPNQFRNGHYTFWNYETYNTNSLVTGDYLTYSNLLKAQILNVDYVYTGIKDDTTFKVKRDSDGAPVYPKATFPPAS